MCESLYQQSPERQRTPSDALSRTRHSYLPEGKEVGTGGGRGRGEEKRRSEQRRRGEEQRRRGGEEELKRSWISRTPAWHLGSRALA